ncbi:MAG: hypothetical protein KC517_09290 [Bacteroidetes bacterium]|nr:hypothetical protein [Bacteroidota bacterium]
MKYLGCDKNYFPGGEPNPYVLYVPKNHTQDNFAIQFEVKENNCVASIYYATILQDGESAETGDIIMVFDKTLCVTLDVWEKYFFPTFTNDYQWYHKEEYNDDIGALSEAMEYARNKAVELIKGG